MSRKSSAHHANSALLDELVDETPELMARLDAPSPSDAPVPMLAISDIAPDPQQPRKRIRQAALDALTEDIRRVGVLQPVVVRPAADWNGYHLVFGERRYRAALQAGLTHLPAFVRRDLSDADVLEIQWQENAQREDVDDIDKALHLRRWKELRGLSWSEMAERIHLSRRHLLRMQQMAEMPETILDFVRERQLTPSHLYQLARMSSAERRFELAQQAVVNRWSVQRLSQAIQEEMVSTPTAERQVNLHPWSSLVDALRDRLLSGSPPSAEEQVLLRRIVDLTQSLLHGQRIKNEQNQNR